MSFLVIRHQKFYSSTEIVISWYISTTVRGKKSNRCYLYHMCTHVSSRFFFFFLMSHLDLCVNPIEFCFWLILFSYFPNLVIGLSFFFSLEFTSHLLPFALDSWLCPVLCMSNFVSIYVIYYWIRKHFLCIISYYKNLKFKHLIDNIVINFWSSKNFTNIKDRKKNVIQWWICQNLHSIKWWVNCK